MALEIGTFGSYTW